MDLPRSFCRLTFVFALFVFLSLLAASIQAPEFQPSEEWNSTFGAQYGDGAWSLQGTGDGGYIITGYTSSRGEGSDLWLVKINPEGKEQWNKTFGGSGEDVGYSVRQTPDGGYIVSGSTRSYGIGEERMWLLKTDSNGNKEWDRTFGGFVSSSGDAGWAVDETDDGGYIVAGYTRSSGAGAKDLWLVKTDSLGNLLWDRTFGGAKDDVGMSVIQTRDGGYVVAGRTASFGPGDDDIWLLKANSVGRDQWNRTFGGSGDDVSFQVIELEDGYALTGRTESGSGSSGGKKAFLMKTDTQGKKQWEKTYGQESAGISLQQTNDDGFIIAGSTDSLIAGKDALLIKTDSSGNKQWIMPLGGLKDDVGTAVVESRDGGYVLAGITSSFGAGAEDAWLVKLATTPGDFAGNITSRKIIDTAVPGNASENNENNVGTNIITGTNITTNTGSTGLPESESQNILVPPTPFQQLKVPVNKMRT